MIIVMNTLFANYIITKYVYPINIVNCIVFLAGMLNRLYGFDNLHENISGIVMTIISVSLMTGTYLYINTALINLHLVEI